MRYPPHAHTWSLRKRLLFLDIRSAVTRQQMDALRTSERLDEYCERMADRAIERGVSVVSEAFLLSMDAISDAVN